VMSFASNHALDYGDEALFDTLDVMRENHIAVIGAGKTIAEARRPAIFKRKGTTIGFLAYCSVVPRGFQAEENKSGVAPLRATTAYQPVDWQAGMPPKVVTRTFPGDLGAMEDDIRHLRKQVDILVVSMHWGVHFVPSIIADYQYEAGHAAIDAGADLIIGTHAHILKGIEVYKGKVIFFSLCNFNMDLPLAGSVAEEMAASQQRPAMTAVKIDENNRADVGFHRWEVDPEYPTYAFPIDSQKTMLVKCTISNKKIQRVAFLPLWMNTKGQPEPLSETDPRNEEVFSYMKRLCKDQELDTRFIRDGDEIVVVAGNGKIEK